MEWGGDPEGMGPQGLEERLGRLEDCVILLLRMQDKWVGFRPCCTLVLMETLHTQHHAGCCAGHDLVAALVVLSELRPLGSSSSSSPPAGTC